MEASMTTLRKLTVSEARYHELCEMYYGLCRVCGCERECTEPDAENYHCEDCGQDEVFGTEQLLLRGELTITTD